MKQNKKPPFFNALLVTAFLLSVQLSFGQKTPKEQPEDAIPAEIMALQVPVLEMIAFVTEGNQPSKALAHAILSHIALIRAEKSYPPLTETEIKSWSKLYLISTHQVESLDNIARRFAELQE